MNVYVLYINKKFYILRLRCITLYKVLLQVSKEIRIVTNTQKRVKSILVLNWKLKYIYIYHLWA